MKLDAGSMGAIAAAVLVPVVMRLLARLFPDRAPPTTTITLAELQARYLKWEVGLAVAILLACVPLGAGIWLALRGVAAAHDALLPPSELLWDVSPFYWAVPAALLAFALLIPISAGLERLLLGERLGEYLAYQRLRTHMDVARVARLVGTVAAVASALLIFLGLDWSVQLRADGLVVNRFLSVGEERHAFGDIVAIRTAPALVAPNGNLVARREYVVRFADGRSWSTNNLLSDPTEADKQLLVERLAARSGKRLEEVAVLRNEEL